MPTVQSMLTARLAGDSFSLVTIGRDPTAQLRAWSDARKLFCPLCGASVVLRAGTVLAPHFAHRAGVACSHPHAEPETEEHRAGKSLLADWLAVRLPEATVTLEAVLPDTGQRADVLAILPQGQRIALEYQCANLTAREWRRRHGLYEQAGIADLWLLGGSRLRWSENSLPTEELERTLAAEGVPLLFLDSVGEYLPAGTLARFRPSVRETVSADRSQPRTSLLHGRLVSRPLQDLPFPFHLLNREDDSATAAARLPNSPGRSASSAITSPASEPFSEDARLERWLRLRHGITPETLPVFFGVEVRGQEVFHCSPALWQACVYYRWIQGRIGEAWWVEEVNVWARRYLPLTETTGRRVWRVLSEYQQILSAAGLLTIPYGKGCARVLTDFSTLGRIPDAAAALRIAAYRKTRTRD